MPTRSPEIITRASEVDSDLVPEPWDARDNASDRSLVAERERYRLEGVTDSGGAGIVPAYNLNVADTEAIPQNTQDGWTRGSAGRVLNAQGRYVSKGSDVPRKSFDGEEPGLLVEASSRTNVVQYSSAVNQSNWSTFRVNTNSVNSLLKGEDAYKCTTTNNEPNASITQASSGTFSGSSETLKLLAEKESADKIGILVQNTTSLNFLFEIEYTFSTDTLNVAGGSLGESNVRVLDTSGPNGGRTVEITIRYTGGNVENVSGEGRKFFIRPDLQGNNDATTIHHAQIEEAPNASSPIVTGGSATTRSADNYAISVGDWWNTTEGSFLLTGTSRVFAKGNTFGNPAQRWIKHGANTAQLHYNEGILQLFDDSGNTVEVLDATAAFSPVSVGFSFTQNEMRISANGLSDNGPHDGSWLTKPSNILLGLLAVSVTFQDVSYIPRALPESTLNQITS